MSNITNQEQYEYLLISTPQIILDKEGNSREPEYLFTVDPKVIPYETEECLTDDLLKNEIETNGLINGVRDYRTIKGMFSVLGEKLLVLQIPSNSFPSTNGVNSLSPKPIITKINYGPKDDVQSFEITKSLIHGVLLPNGEYINNPNYTTDYAPKGMLPIPVLELQKGRKQRH